MDKKLKGIEVAMECLKKASFPGCGDEVTEDGLHESLFQRS
jgi:hypothetical protein